jgi:hypothetical protein
MRVVLAMKWVWMMLVQPPDHHSQLVCTRLRCKTY